MLRNAAILKNLKIITDNYLSFFLEMKNECDKLDEHLGPNYFDKYSENNNDGEGEREGEREGEGEGEAEEKAPKKTEEELETETETEDEDEQSNGEDDPDASSKPDEKYNIFNELTLFKLYFNERNFSIQMANANTINAIIVNKLKRVCDHNIIEDDIDIDVDRTQRIKYCSKCECTFDL